MTYADTAKRIPTDAELEALRAEVFGERGGGTVRADIPMANTGPDAPPTRLVLVDGAGQVVGERAYRGPGQIGPVPYFGPAHLAEFDRIAPEDIGRTHPGGMLVVVGTTARVFDRPGVRGDAGAIGTAEYAGPVDGEATWTLKARRLELDGVYVLRGGEFIPLNP